MKPVMTTLILIASMMVGAVASASTSPIWADRVGAAVKTANDANAKIAGTGNCKGLKELLDLGATGSGDSTSGTVGEIRSNLYTLDVLAAQVHFTLASGDEDTAARSQAFKKIIDIKGDVMKKVSDRVNELVAKLHFC